MSGIYNNILDQFASKQLDWTTDSFAFVLLSDTALFNAADTTTDDLTAGSILATSSSVLAPSVSDGWLVSADVSFPSLTTTGLVHHSALICQIQTPALLVAFFSSGTGLPYQFTGGDYYLRRDQSYPGWCRI